MGGNVTKAVSRKAVRSLKNINVEERAHKKIDKHLKNPIAAPRHESTKDIIEKHVAVHRPSENPHVKEELKREDPSLINRVNRLQLEVTDEAPKFSSKDRPLPQSKESVDDPLSAFERPKQIPKGCISYQILFNVLEGHKNEPIAFKAEVMAKEHDLKVQDASNILQYFEKINSEDLDEANPGRKLIGKRLVMDFKVDHGFDNDQDVKKTPS